MLHVLMAFEEVNLFRNKTVFDFNFYDLKTAGDDFMGPD